MESRMSISFEIFTIDTRIACFFSFISNSECRIIPGRVARRCIRRRLLTEPRFGVDGALIVQCDEKKLMEFRCARILRSMLNLLRAQVHHHPAPLVFGFKFEHITPSPFHFLSYCRAMGGFGFLRKNRNQTSNVKHSISMRRPFCQIAQNQLPSNVFFVVSHELNCALISPNKPKITFNSVQVSWAKC